MGHRAYRRPCPAPGMVAVEVVSDRAFARHTHDQFGVGLVEHGAQRSASGRGPVEAQAGDVITVNPGEVHDGVPLGTGGRAWRMLYLDPAVVAALAAEQEHGACREGEFTRPVLRDAMVAGCFRRLFTATVAAADGLERDQALVALFDRLWRPSPAVATAAVPAGVARARQRLDDDPAAGVSLAELAAEAGLSRFQVLRGFVRLTGLPPHAYQLQRRLQVARRAIVAGQPLVEAAQLAGFADQSHMTRLFVRSYGLTPGAYARAGG